LRVISDFASVITDWDVDVTLVSPPGVPRVADAEDVVAANVGVAGDDDGVVDAALAGAWGEDATLVEVEVSGVDGDGGGAVGVDVGEESSLALDSVDASDASGGHGSVVTAATVAGLVGVGGLRGGATSVVDVGPGGAVPASVATVVVGVGAVDHLLGGEGGEAASGDGPLGLEGLNRSEGPAGAALSLVLDGGDDAALSPVEEGEGTLVRGNLTPEGW